MTHLFTMFTTASVELTHHFHIHIQIAFAVNNPHNFLHGIVQAFDKTTLRNFFAVTTLQPIKIRTNYFRNLYGTQVHFLFRQINIVLLKELVEQCTND